MKDCLNLFFNRSLNILANLFYKVSKSISGRRKGVAQFYEPFLGNKNTFKNRLVCIWFSYLIFIYDIHGEMSSVVDISLCTGIRIIPKDTWASSKVCSKSNKFKLIQNEFRRIGKSCHQIRLVIILCAKRLVTCQIGLKIE